MFIGTGARSSSDHRFDDARSGSLQNERGPDERRAEEPGKVNVLLPTYGVSELPTAGSLA